MSGAVEASLDLYVAYSQIMMPERYDPVFDNKGGLRDTIWSGRVNTIGVFTTYAKAESALDRRHERMPSTVLMQFEVAAIGGYLGGPCEWTRDVKWPEGPNTWDLIKMVRVDADA